MVASTHSLFIRAASALCLHVYQPYLQHTVQSYSEDDVASESSYVITFDLFSGNFLLGFNFSKTSRVS